MLIEEKHLIYLDRLRDSGSINMLASPQKLMIKFEISLNEAKILFNEWKDTYSQRHVVVTVNTADVVNRIQNNMKGSI